MGFWNFIGGFALFNLVCDMFSSKPKPTYIPHRQHFHDYDHEDYLMSVSDASDLDALQDRINELEARLAQTDVMSDSYDEIQERIDDLQNRVDYLEEMEDIQFELDDLRDELDDMEIDRDSYYDHDLYDDDPDDW